MLGYNFEIIYKKSKSILLWQMHFEGKEKRLKILFVLLPFYKMIGWKKLGLKGKRIRSHGCSFNNQKRTLVHHIKLCGRVIHFIIIIAYIYIRISNLNKMYFSNFSLLLQGVTHKKLTIGSRRIFYGKVCQKIMVKCLVSSRTKKRQ